MTLQEIMDTVNDKLRLFGGQMSTVNLTPTMYMREANRAARYLAAETHCLQVARYFTTTAGKAYYSLENMLDVSRVVYDGLPISRLDENLLGKIFTDRGTPQFYAFEEPSQIRLFPIPESTKILWYFGYRYPTPVSSTGDSVDLPSILADVVVDWVEAEMVAIVQPELYQEKYGKWENKLAHYVQANKHKATDPNQEPLDNFFEGPSYGGGIGMDFY